MNLGGGGGGTAAAAGQAAVGDGGEDTELGTGADGVVGISIDGETMSGKRKNVQSTNARDRVATSEMHR